MNNEDYIGGLFGVSGDDLRDAPPTVNSYDLSVYQYLCEWVKNYTGAPPTINN